MKLLETTSPLYLKRLVRELNATPDGFYFGSYRCNRARFTQGRIEVRPIGRAFVTPDANEFRDAYGRDIVASRHMRGVTGGGL